MPRDQELHEASREGQSANPLRNSLSVRDWLKREIPPKDPLLGQWLHTTARVLLDGPTGAGKSLLALEIAFSVALGRPFLHWAKGNTPRSVLYIDGEMGAQEVQERLQDFADRYGVYPEGLHVLCSEDADMPSFDDPGASWGDWLESYCREHGIALVIVDNLMSVVGGTLKEEDTWKAVEPIAIALSANRIASLWLHHTGHNTSRFFGNSQVAWKMTAAIHIEQKGRDPLKIKLVFPKARSQHKAPDDYKPVMLTLQGKRWSVEEDKEERLDSLLDALKEKMNGSRTLDRAGLAVFAAEQDIALTNLCRKNGPLDKLAVEGRIKITRGVTKGSKNGIVKLELLRAV